MQITISGTPGSGKSTVAELVAQRLGLKHYSAGDFMRAVARDRGIDIIQLNQIAETDPTIDKAVDDKLRQLSEEEDDFIIDARLGWHFIPNSLKIFLNVKPKIGAERIFAAKRSDEKFDVDIESTLAKANQRKELEQRRWQKEYSVDHLDPANYDLLIDSTGMSLGDVVDKIVEFVQKQD